MKSLIKLNGCSPDKDLVDDYNSMAGNYYNDDDVTNIKYEPKILGIFGGAPGEVKYSSLKDRLGDLERENDIRGVCLKGSEFGGKLDEIMLFYFCGLSDAQKKARESMAKIKSNKTNGSIKASDLYNTNEEKPNLVGLFTQMYKDIIGRPYDENIPDYFSFDQYVTWRESELYEEWDSERRKAIEKFG